MASSLHNGSASDTRDITVAHVGAYRPGSTNGVHRSIAHLVFQLSHENVCPQVWHFTSKVDQPVRREVDGITVIDLPARKRLLHRHLDVPGETRRWLADHGSEVDVIHLHSVFQPESHHLSQLGVPYVVTPHGGYNRHVLLGRNRRKKAIAMRLREVPHLRRARLIHLVSPTEEADLAPFGIATSRIVVPNGVEVPTEAPTRPDMASGHFLFIGRLDIYLKGLDRLLAGYAECRRRLGAATPPLVVAGPDFRDGRRRLEQLADELDLVDLVRFPGLVEGEQRDQLLADARAFIHTSRSEGLPLAVIEALAAGLPVVLTEGANLTGPVGAAAAGWISGDTPDHIGEALADAATTDSETLAAMGRRAHQLAWSTYRWERVAAQLADAYRSVVDAS